MRVPPPSPLRGLASDALSLRRPALVSRVYALASQLKYHDAHYQSGEGELAEMGDPEWLLALQNVLVDMQVR